MQLILVVEGLEILNRNYFTHFFRVGCFFSLENNPLGNFLIHDFSATTERLFYIKTGINTILSKELFHLFNTSRDLFLCSLLLIKLERVQRNECDGRKSCIGFFITYHWKYFEYIFKNLKSIFIVVCYYNFFTYLCV